MAVWGEGEPGGRGEVLNFAVDHILQEFYTLFLTRFRTYKIASPRQTKMTNKEDGIKGLVSLKFLRPWCGIIYRCGDTVVGRPHVEPEPETVMVHCSG